MVTLSQAIYRTLYIHQNNVVYSLASVGFGGPSAGSPNAHESFSFIGTALEGISIDRLTFSIDTSTLSVFPSHYSISEIRVFGAPDPTVPVPVPEPSTLFILALTILGLAPRRYKK